MNLDQERITLAYEREQLALELTHLVNRHDPKTVGPYPMHDCGVYAFLEINENYGHFGYSTHLQFQGRKCDFQKFADCFGIILKEEHFTTSPAPCYKPSPLCKLNKHDSPMGMHLFKSKRPISVPYPTRSKKGDQFIVPITAPLKPKIKARPPIFHPCRMGYLPGTYDSVPVETTQKLKEDISKFKSLIAQAQGNRRRNVDKLISKLDDLWNEEPSKKAGKFKKAQSSNSFRSAIKKFASEKTYEPEQAEIPVASVDNEQKTKAEKSKKTKHQGKAKTFKRKTKRPGRV